MNNIRDVVSDSQSLGFFGITTKGIGKGRQQSNQAGKRNPYGHRNERAFYGICQGDTKRINNLFKKNQCQQRQARLHQHDQKIDQSPARCSTPCQTPGPMQGHKCF